MTPSKTKFRVIIVGGGIAGLTLANSLQNAGIDFLVLEGRSEIAPRIGASIGLFPNGSRILDQLGCYEELENLAEPIRFVGYHDCHGNEIFPRSPALQLIQTRTNYPVTFLDRSHVLRVLAKNVRDQSKILMNKKVAHVEHSSNRVVVQCSDGTSYSGEIVVGADGISSKIRREMWRAAEGEISHAHKPAISAEYKCLFGVSSGLPMLPSGHLNVTHKKDVSSLVVIGKGGDILWFLFARLSHVYRDQDIPRFTDSDTELFAQRHLDLPILPNGTVTFGNIWLQRRIATLLAVEEADFPTWTWGRFACVGDSVHKMTPNMGAGGMAAIESAAALANSIFSLLSESEYRKELAPTLGDIHRALFQYHESRKQRASRVIRLSNQLTRIQAIRGLKEYLLVHVGIRYGGNYLIHASVAEWVGAPLLHFLPPPSRSLTAIMSFDTPANTTKWLTHLRRTLFMLVLLLAVCLLLFIEPWTESNSALRKVDFFIVLGCLSVVFGSGAYTRLR